MPFGIDGDGFYLRSRRTDGSLDGRPRLTFVEDDRLIIADTPLVEDMDIAANCMRAPARINTGCPQMS